MKLQHIDRIRTASRQIVRDLGFMQKTLAGTTLPPSAVHTLIEVGLGTVSTARDLGALLHLEKSSVSRMLHKLERDGLITATADPRDTRKRVLSLTAQGLDLLGQIEDHARSTLTRALDGITDRDIGRIETGLGLYAQALSGIRQSPTQPGPITVHEGYHPGLIGEVTQLHALYYAENYGFGAVFERKVATEMAEFMGRVEAPSNATFSATLGPTLLGSISLDGEDLEDGVSHLRWFIVSPRAQGMGAGRLLLGRALSFADSIGARETRLWTFKGLDAARHLYETHGFVLTHEAPGQQWGTEVVEQEFRRKRP